MSAAATIPHEDEVWISPRCLEAGITADSKLPGMPSGPRMLPTLVQSYFSWQWLLPWSKAIQGIYGDTVTMHVIPGGRAVAVADHELVKEIITGPAEVFHAGEGNSILGEVLGRRSVLVIDEEEHLQTRRKLLPPFHGEAVHRYEEIVREETLKDLATWPVGRRFRVDEHMRDVTLEVILRAVLGAERSPRYEELRSTMDAVTRINVYIALYFFVPALRRMPPWRTYVRDLRRAEQLVMAEIADRRSAPDLDERDDVLSMLIRAGAEDDDWLRDQIFTLLEAGHETTTTALSWAIELLAHYPEVAEKARNSDDDYIDAIINETLRIRPVIPGITRKTTKPVIVGGRRYPAGVTFVPLSNTIHHDGKLYPEPDRFRPERFLGTRPGTYTWIPSAAVAACLGATFAQVEMRVILRTLLGGADWRAARKRFERPVNAHITLVPHRGGRIVRTR